MEQTTALNWVTSIATAVAVIVALAGYAIIEWQRRQAIRQSRRTSVHMIGIRAFRLLNHFCDLERHFAKFAPIDWKESRGLLPSVHPMLGLNFDPMVVMDKDEIAVLIESNEADFLTNMMLAASRYESIVLSFNEYRDRYDELYRMAPPPDSMEGLVATHRLAKPDYLKLRPYSIQLFQLVDALRDMVVENVALCRKLTQDYHPLMKTRFKNEKFVSFHDAPSDVTESEH